MAKRILIKSGSVEVIAELNDTRTAQSIWAALPLKGRVNTWGDEIYFSIPLDLELEDGKELVEVGDLGYWPAGNAFCIFFGPTLASRGNEVRPASAVTVFGRVVGNTDISRQVTSGSGIVVEMGK
jgi:hypothetical protein